MSKTTNSEKNQLQIFKMIDFMSRTLIYYFNTDVFFALLIKKKNHFGFGVILTLGEHTIYPNR